MANRIRASRYASPEMADGSTVTAAQPSSENPALLRTLRVVRERWWLVALSLPVCTGITTALSLRAVKQYPAPATLLIQPSNLTTLVNRSQSTDSATQARQQSDYL